MSQSIDQLAHGFASERRYPPDARRGVLDGFCRNRSGDEGAIFEKVRSGRCSFTPAFDFRAERLSFAAGKGGEERVKEFAEVDPNTFGLRPA